MQQQLEELVKEAQAAVDGTNDLSELDAVRVHYLGKKGALTQQMQSLGKLPAEERRDAGMVINVAKQAVQNAIEQRRTTLQTELLNNKLSSEAIDVSLPGRGQQNGGLHPVTRTLQRIEALFTQLGFEIAEGRFF